MFKFALLAASILHAHAGLTTDEQIDLMRRKALFLTDGSPPPARLFVDADEAEMLLWMRTRLGEQKDRVAGDLSALDEVYRAALADPIAHRANVRAAERRVTASIADGLRENLEVFALDYRTSRVDDLLTIERELTKRTGIARPDLHEALDLVARPDQIMARAAARTLRLLHRTNVYSDEISAIVLSHLAETAPRRALEIAWSWETLDDALTAHVLRASGMNLGTAGRPFRVQPADFGRERVMAMMTDVDAVGTFIGQLIGAVVRCRELRAELGRLRESTLRARALAVVERFEDEISTQIQNLRADVEAYAAADGVAVTLGPAQWQAVDALAKCTRELTAGRRWDGARRE